MSTKLLKQEQISSLTITSIQSSSVEKPIIDGYYIFTAVPSNSLPSGISLDDIALLAGGNWSRAFSYENAPATISVGTSNPLIYAKNGSNSWAFVLTESDGDLTTKVDKINITGGTAGSANSVPVFNYNEQGQLTTNTDTLIDILADQVSDFSEAAQDAIAGTYAATTTITPVYDDTLNQSEWNVNDNSITNLKLSDTSNASSRNLWVDRFEGSSSNSGKLSYKPKQFIQQGIDAATFGAVININSYQYNENLTITAASANLKDNLCIYSEGNTGSFPTVVDGDLTISGVVTRIRLRSVQIGSTAGKGLITFDGDEGRHYFDNVYFNNGITAKNTFKRWHDFNNCSGKGIVSLGEIGTPASGCNFFFQNCDFTDVTDFRIGHANVTVIFYNCRRLPQKITHIAGNLIIIPPATFESSNSTFIESICNTGSGKIVLWNGYNFMKSDNTTFGRINKTGTCTIYLGQGIRDYANDVLSGTVVYLQKTNDLDTGITPTNYTISGTLLNSHINAIDAKIGTLQSAIGYTPENIANKENTTLDSNTSKYPTNNLVKSYVDTADATKINKSDFTAKGDILVATGNGTYQKLAAGSNGQALVVDTTQATGLKYSTTASYSAANNKTYYQQVSGNDGNIGYDINRPFATVGQASTTAGNSGQLIVCLPQTSSENPTITALNQTFTSLGEETGGIVNFTGTWTVSASGGSSTRINGLSIATLNHTGSDALHTYNARVNVSFSSSSTGFYRAFNTDFTTNNITNISITGAGYKNFENGCALGQTIINNASAVVTIREAQKVQYFGNVKGLYNASTNSPSLTNGTGAVGDLYIVSVGGTRNFGAGNITFSAGDLVYYANNVWSKKLYADSTTLTLTSGLLLLRNTTVITYGSTYLALSALSGVVDCENVRFINADGTDANIYIATGVQYTLRNCTYASSSTIAGTNLGLISYFDRINLAKGTASQLLATDASKNVQSLTTATYPSLTEIAFVKGVTSAIQTQFTGKQNIISSPTANDLVSVNAGGQVIDSGYSVSNTSTANSALQILTAAAAQSAITNAQLSNSLSTGAKYLVNSDFAATYNNGTSGVGATLTASSTGTVSFDGSNPSVGDRIWFNGQSTLAQNGMYICTTAGATGVAAVFTRTTDFNTSAQMKSARLFVVIGGSTFINTIWSTAYSVTTVGTDPMGAVNTSISVAGYPQITNNLSEYTATASTARANLSAAKNGANSDITSLSGLTTALSIAQGGTGQTTQQAALNAIAGTQSSGKFLRSDGTNTTLSNIQASDVPTLNQNTSGTAANITSTSNSTLTSLPSLSLPFSQVSGNITTAQLPGSGVNGASQLVQLTAAGKYPALDGSLIINLPSTASTWGAISGTLSDQTDLQAALDAKANQSTTYTKTEVDSIASGKEGTVSSGTITQYYRGDKTWQTLNASAVAGLATSATTDTTNASNISGGTLNAARLPTPTSSTLGGVKSLAATATKFLTAIGLDGTPAATQPVFTDISGNIAPSQLPNGGVNGNSQLVQTNSTGQLPSLDGSNLYNVQASNGTQYTKTNHGFVAGNVLSYNNSLVIVKADFSNVATSTQLIGIVTKVIDANNFIVAKSGNTIDDVPSSAIDIGGTLYQGGFYYPSTTSAGKLSLTVPTNTRAKQISLLALGTLTGVIYFAPTSITGGIAATDVSGLAASATTNTTNASNISSGTLAGARLPNPQTSVLGGTKSATAPSNQFQTGIDASGNPTFAQPSFSNLSGNFTPSQYPDGIDVFSYTNVIKNSILDLDASVDTNFLFSSGTVISDWLDGCGNYVNDASQGTAAKRPSLVTGLNSKVVSFDGSNDGLISPLDLTRTNRYANVSGFAIFNTKSLDGNRTIIKSDGGYGRSIQIDNRQPGGGYKLCYFNGTGVALIDTITINTWYLLSWEWNYSKNTFSAWLNGVQKVNAASCTATGTTATGIGCDHDSTVTFWNGYIAKILLCNKILSSTERVNMEKYLDIKWGLNLGI